MRYFIVKQMLRRQKGMFKKLHELEKSQYYSQNDLKIIQNMKLQKLIRHAYNTVPYYKDIFVNNKLKPDDIKTSEDLMKLPILDKETLRSERKKLMSGHIKDKVFTRRTGGSTGVPLSISYNYETFINENALYFRYLRSIGYNWGDEILRFWGERVVESIFSKLKSSISNFIYNVNFVSTFKLNNSYLEELILYLQKKPPQILRGYASSLNQLAVSTLDRGLTIKLNAISSTAEKLYNFQRKNIQKAFGDNIFDQYGSGEVHCVAFECEKHKGLHVASEHTVLELVDDKGVKSKQGNVIVTDLDNYAMPIIRYKNEDVARWASTGCNCKRHTPLLEEIEGRVSDFIEGPNGNKVHAEFFTHIFGGLKLADKYSIKEFRTVQEQLDKLRIEFVTTDSIAKSDESVIHEKISDYLGNMEIEIKNVDSIPLTRMGKKMFVLSLLNKDKWEQ